jgi:hypothetical protein
METFLATSVMSAKCQKRTFLSPDDLVGTGDQWWRHREASSIYIKRTFAVH